MMHCLVFYSLLFVCCWWNITLLFLFTCLQNSLTYFLFLFVGGTRIKHAGCYWDFLMLMINESVSAFSIPLLQSSVLSGSVFLSLGWVYVAEDYRLLLCFCLLLAEADKKCSNILLRGKIRREGWKFLHAILLTVIQEMCHLFNFSILW